MLKDLVTVETVYIKLKDCKRYKSIIFLHNGKRESLIVGANVGVKEGDSIEYGYLLNLSKNIT